MDNDHKGLLVKSKQNKECVHWAENKGYYDVALSRYYIIQSFKKSFIF